MRRFKYLVVLMLASWVPSLAANAQEDIGQGRAVLVTGATSGIGRATAELLAENGFYVYAGARKQADMDELNAIDNIEAIRIDVSKQDQIDAAVEQVRAGGRGLHGLINNAGVLVMAPLIEVTDEDMMFQFDVNVFGPMRVTRAFAPMLLESGGRVSTTSSISGFLTWGIGGPYTMSKHAVEAYCETLVAELEPFGVKVSVVEPGNFESKIWDSYVDRLEANGYTTEGSIYKDRLDGLFERMEEPRESKDPAEVAEAFLHAMSSDEPKFRYLVTPNEREAHRTIEGVIVRLVELNADQPYSMSRDELVAMLDEQLGRAAGE